jgi:hypothetical protein
MPVLCFFLGRRFRTLFVWLLVTLFPLSDGGVLVAVTTCAVVSGYYFVASVECGLPFGLVLIFSAIAVFPVFCVLDTTTS